MPKVALEVISGNGLRLSHQDGLEFAAGTILLMGPTQLCDFHVLNEIIPQRHKLIA